MIRILSILLIIAALDVHSSAQAQAVAPIEVGPGDNPLEITGWTGEDNAFVGNLRLMARSGAIPKFIFLASDLKRTEDNQIVGRQQVVLVGDATLDVSTPKDFQVKVNRISLPGTYAGHLSLLLPGQTLSEGLSIPITVTAKERPTLIALPGTDKVQLRLVNCGGSILGVLDCGLAHLFLPSGAFMDSIELQFNNTTQAQVEVTDSTVIALGDNTRYQLTDSTVRLVSPTQILPANAVVHLPMTLTRELMPADKYTGWVYLTLAGRDDKLIIPLNVSVQIGPLLPLVLLFLGVMVGYLNKRSQDKAAKPTITPANPGTPSSPTITPASLGTPTPQKSWWQTLEGWRQKLERVPGVLVQVSGVLVKALLYGGTFLLLLIIGMQLFYVNNGIAFGANPVSDYLSVAVWGLSADVAGRTLANLPLLGK